MTIYINDLINFNADNDEAQIERILWIDEGRIITFTIDVEAKSALPVLRKVKDIEEGLESELYTKEESNIHIRLVRENELSDKDRELRDKAWKIIEPIVNACNEPKIYYREYRGALIKDILDKENISKVMLYKYLRKYWQRGKHINALLPDYVNCGGKGKTKTVGTKKMGRPRKNSFITGEGVNVDESTKKVFRLAINKYYNGKESYLTYVYEQMKRDFFTEDYKIEDGIRKPILMPSSQIPTMTQFRYWYENEKDKDIKKEIISRKGSKKFELENRAVIHKADDGILGPGWQYQIDATVGDIYLISRYNRNWIIGRPIIYIVIDAFSRMIAGFYVGLEGPSWTGAAMAIANAATDKVKYCKDIFNININESEWPCHHLPEAILGDRGEMIGKNAEIIMSSLHMRVDNTPPFRADWKPFVERYFKTLNIKVKPLLPGYINVDFRERGGHDYRLDARLDICQFTEIVVRCIIEYNNNKWMDFYNRDTMLIADEVRPIPIDLWNWGIANRSGHLRTFPEDIIKLNLMPIKQASVTEHGIRYNKMHYSCETAIKDMWFEKARNKGSWKVDISFDPRNMNYIYIRAKDGRSFEKCTLLEQNRFSNKTLDEIEYLLAYEKLQKDKEKDIISQSSSDLASQVENIVRKAELMTSEQKDSTLSKSNRIKGIKNNRKNEKGKMRETEFFNLGENGEKPKDKEAEVVYINQEDDDLSYPDNIDFLKRKQRERLHGKKS